MSNHPNSIIVNSLYNKLKIKETNLELPDNVYTGISVYLYRLTDTHIESRYENYNSINSLSLKIKVSKATIKMYLNTNVPYKSLLFYTNPLENFKLSYEIVKNSSMGLNLNHNVAKEVWVYSIISDSEINNQVFSSREKVANFLNVSSNNIRDYIDK